MPKHGDKIEEPYLSQISKFWHWLQTQRLPHTIRMQQWVHACCRWTIIKSSFIGEMVSPSWRKKDQELNINKIIT